MTHVSRGRGQWRAVGTQVRDSTGELAWFVDLMPALRRFVLSIARDPHDADDVVQETVTRLLPVQDRLDDAALTGYAFTVARNLVNDLHRQSTRARRLLPRLVEGSPPVQPDAVVVQLEERRALHSALDQLPPEQRDLMLAHDLHGAALQSAPPGGSPGALAARLSRARARARVDYVLALRGVELPTARCRPVLQALSAGDRRRQGALRAGRHLVHCTTCAAVAPVLVRRDRALAGFLPWWSAGAAIAGMAAAARRHPVQTGVTAAGTTAAAVAMAMVVLPIPSTPAGPSQPVPVTAALQVSGEPLFPQRFRLAEVAGRTARARSAIVVAVPADEGFWVGSGQRRIWVQLRGPGESGVRVRSEDLVSFSGQVVAHGPRFAARAGVTPAEGALELTRQGYHLIVDREVLRLGS